MQYHSFSRSKKPLGQGYAYSIPGQTKGIVVHQGMLWTRGIISRTRVATHIELRRCYLNKHDSGFKTSCLQIVKRICILDTQIGGLKYA